MTVRFSTRTSWDRSESDFAAAIGEARRSEAARGQKLLDLTVSNPTMCGFVYDESAVLGALTTPKAMVYDADPRGMRSAREAVAGYYREHGAAIDPDALVLTTSTSEAYGYVFRLLCDPGDEVLVARPSYPLFDFLADLQDVRLRSYPLFYDYGWWIDFAELARRIGPRTRAILVVHPNNPTGHWTAAAERTRLQSLCAQYGLALIVDEVFLDYPLEPSVDGISFAAETCDALTFILSGMSKIAGLPQMKVAWLLTMGPERERLEALGRLEVVADTFLSMNAPAQHALGAWFTSAGGIQEQIQARTKANLEMARGLGLSVLKVEAGWSAVFRMRPSAEEILKLCGVVVHPGSFYGMEGNRVVVSLLTPTGDFEDGMRRLLLTDLR